MGNCIASVGNWSINESLEGRVEGRERKGLHVVGCNYYFDVP